MSTLMVLGTNAVFCFLTLTVVCVANLERNLTLSSNYLTNYQQKISNFQVESVLNDSQYHCKLSQNILQIPILKLCFDATSVICGIFYSLFAFWVDWAISWCLLPLVKIPLHKNNCCQLHLLFLSPPSLFSFAPFSSPSHFWPERRGCIEWFPLHKISIREFADCAALLQ